MKKFNFFSMLLISMMLLATFIGCDDSSTDPEEVNSKPVANFVVSPDSGVVGTEFSFDASSSSDAEDAVDSLNFRWDFDGDNQFDTDWSMEKTATYKYNEVGTYSVKLEVKDSGELVSSIVKNVEVVENPVPEGMALIEGGSFMMGSANGDAHEQPIHEINLASFYLGKYEVTNAEYCEFLNSEGNQEEGGANWLNINDQNCQIEEVDGIFAPLSGKENYPVIMVSWYGARAYCEWKGGRLPTEAEWEYAARGGKLANNYQYAGSDSLDVVGWYWDNSENADNDISEGKGSHPVGEKLANELGLYDMSGNVFEWCNDWYGEDYYSNSPSDNPTGPEEGTLRVLRGGCWYGIPFYCRVAFRGYYFPEYSYFDFGFRLAMDK